MIFLKAVNTDLERPVTATIRVRGVRVAPRATVARESIASSSAHQLTLTLPPHSIAVITLTVAR
jgi:hypothetical protein